MNTINNSSETQVTGMPNSNICKYWCFMCEQEFSKELTENSEVFCTQCGGISELIQENNDPKEFHVDKPQRESFNTSPLTQTSPQNGPNNTIREETQVSQPRARGHMAIISRVHEGPFGRVVVQTVMPQFSSGMTENALSVNPLAAFMSPLFSGFMGMNGDLESRIIEEFLRNDPNRHGPPPAPKEILDKLPEVKFGEGTCKNKECTVCQEDYKNDDTILTLPCDHNFHKSCVTEWLTRHNSCPICRKGLTEQEQTNTQTSETSEV